MIPDFLDQDSFPFRELVRKENLSLKKFNFPVVCVLHPSDIVTNVDGESIISSLRFTEVDRFCPRTAVNSSGCLF